MGKKQKSPKISVCIPVHNADIWLSQSIESIMHQTFEDWEIVIVDDGSTDDSQIIIDHYLMLFSKLGFPEKIKVHINKKNQGIAKTRNFANNFASGEIICVQDADDVSHKERLEKTWKFFKRHKNVDLVYGSCQYIDALNRPFHMVHGEEFNFERLKQENWIQHPTVAYRRKAILEVPYRPECKVIDDWFLYYDFHKKGKKIANMSDVLSFYRVLSTSVSRSPEKQKLINKMKNKFIEEANK